MVQGILKSIDVIAQEREYTGRKKRESKQTEALQHYLGRTQLQIAQNQLTVD